MTVKQCFTSCHCTCGDCPNVQYDIANNRYGFGIAEDMGLEKISCKECRYNTGKCEDCMFNGTDMCEGERTMREILFRGKRVDNREWTEGYFVPSNERKSLRDSIFVYLPITQSFGCFDIDIDTLGEYTTVKDKRGTRIFEGDVVKLFDIAIGEIVCEYGAFGISCRQQIDYDYLASEIASITGCDNTPMFCRNDNFVSLWELYWNYNQESSEISVIEVIGNIYDNPELLKGEENDD